MVRSGRFFLIACAAVLACASGGAAVDVRISRPRCRLDLPDGFVKEARLDSTRPDHICGYTLGDPLEALLSEGVEAFEATISFGAMRLDTPAVMKPIDSVPAPEGATASTVPWRNFEVPMLEKVTDLAHWKQVSFSVLIPLKPVALVLSLGGPPAKRDEIHAMMLSIVASVEGETNWLTPEQKASREKMMILKVLVLAAAVVGLVVYVTKKRARPSVRRRRRRA